MGLHDDHGAGGGEPAHEGEVALKGPDVGLIITSVFLDINPYLILRKFYRLDLVISPGLEFSVAAQSSSSASALK